MVVLVYISVLLVYKRVFSSTCTTRSQRALSRGEGKGAPSNGHVAPKAAATPAGTGQVVPPRSRRLKTVPCWEFRVLGLRLVGQFKVEEFLEV